MESDEKDKANDMENVQQARRDFLNKAGKLAVYTPPLMMGLLMPGAHAIASGTRPQNREYPHHRYYGEHQQEQYGQQEQHGQREQHGLGQRQSQRQRPRRG